MIICMFIFSYASILLCSYQVYLDVMGNDVLPIKSIPGVNDNIMRLQQSQCLVLISIVLCSTALTAVGMSIVKLALLSANNVSFGLFSAIMPYIQCI